MADNLNQSSKFSDAKKARLRQWSLRKPCIALMGEFSAGKSTLLNFLIEDDLLPTRATATELPPVWFSHGTEDAYWVDAEGDRHPLRLDSLATVPMQARYVRLFLTAEILEHCDIVDTPGISDPNLEAESWRFAAGLANMVLWCTSATQAWRETERGTWASLPERLRKHSLLIVTRADKLLTDVDRDKVARRLARETAGMFHACTFLSTPDAVKAKASLPDGGTSDLWESSGAAQLLDRLAERFEAIYADRNALCERHLAWSDGLSVRRRRSVAAPVQQAPEPESGMIPEPMPEETGAAGPAAADAAEIAAAVPLGAGVMPVRPTRPQLEGGGRRPERPRLVETDAPLADRPDERPPAGGAEAGAEAEADAKAPLVLGSAFEVVRSPLQEAARNVDEPVAEADAEADAADAAQAMAVDAEAPEPAREDASEVETWAMDEVTAQAEIAEAAFENAEARPEEAGAEAEPEDVAAEAQPEQVKAEAEAEPEDLAAEAATEDAAEEVADEVAAVAVPAQVALWRELVAGRGGELSGTEVVSLIDEFLCRLHGAGSASDAAGVPDAETAAEAAPEPAAEVAEETGADAGAESPPEPEAAAEPAAPGKAEAAATGWRRLA